MNTWTTYHHKDVIYLVTNREGHQESVSETIQSEADVDDIHDHTGTLSLHSHNKEYEKKKISKELESHQLVQFIIYLIMYY